MTPQFVPFEPGMEGKFIPYEVLEEGGMAEVEVLRKNTGEQQPQKEQPSK